ncbi:MAG: 50S ribosomal protein L24 [Pseudomonadota bacterium]
MNRLKTGDNVVVIAGKDKGAKGKVIKLLKPKYRAIVEGVNLVKKHVKRNPQANQQGGIIEKEASIHLSNLAIVNPVTDKPDRIGFKVLDNGKKVRYCKSNDEVIDT